MTKPGPTGSADAPYVIVLGIAQDGGVPQAGEEDHPGWTDPAFVRRAACIGLVDPVANLRVLVDATPDIREQLRVLDTIAPRAAGARPLDGIVLTHAHVGHYAGLIHLGPECMNTRGVPLYAMPRMLRFLRANAPWDALLRDDHLTPRTLAATIEVPLTPRLSITPVAVTHRGPYSETIGLRFSGPTRAVLYVPDADGWEVWERDGTRVETLIREVDVAYLDGTFYDEAELPGRDLTAVPHPTIAASLRRFDALPAPERAKIRFIHLNHSNPALWSGTPAAEAVARGGLSVAREREVVRL